MQSFLHTTYRYGIRPLLFCFSSETIHEYLTAVGENISKSTLAKKLLTKILVRSEPALEQTLTNIQFKNPIGLSAGFDYKAQLTQITPCLGFGFQTIGTITNNPYEGNPKPRLGRLIKSKSLLVNKGFKNNGIDAIMLKLNKKSFQIPIGLSVGRTNSLSITTLKDSIKDICEALLKAENSHIPFSYYEINISCPNLFGDISFYPPKNLHALLSAISKIRVTLPIFIKMPIEKSNKEVEEMLNVIIKFKIQGVIFGNLQKNRNDPSLIQQEVKKYPVGNFSGKPTQKRSNELIKFAYQKYGKKLIIIGCGGVFSAEDAYQKIRLGASLIQLITGLVFEGPQIISEINKGLFLLLHKDGFSHISEVIGIDAN